MMIPRGKGLCLTYPCSYAQNLDRGCCEAVIQIVVEILCE